MTAAPRQHARSPRPRQYVIRRAQGSYQRPAAARLIASGGPSEADLDRFLLAASAHGIDLTHLWASFEDGRMRAREAVLAVTGAGRSAMVFTSAPETEESIPELAEVIMMAMEGLDGVVLGQALLQPEEEIPAQAFEAAGWQEIAQLAYLRRKFEKGDEALASGGAALLGDVTLRGYRGAEDEEIFAEALDASYIDTLDCPELCGMRAASDVIESHRAAGQFDPELWWLLEDQSGPAGVLLFNPNPEQDAIELVYIGLAPRLRGTGLSRRLMEFAIGRLATYPGREITCAVDLRNSPARRLYESLGFRLFGRRRALVCALESS